MGSDANTPQMSANQPMERTPPCCALRRRSSARWADAGWFVDIRLLAVICTYCRVPKGKEESAKVETKRSGLTQDQLVLIERMASQKKGVLLDRKTRCVENTWNKNCRLGHHATEMTNRPEYEDSRSMPRAPFKSRPGLGLVGGERSPRQ